MFFETFVDSDGNFPENEKPGIDVLERLSVLFLASRC